MKNLNYLMDCIMYQIFKIVLSISKKHGENTNNTSIKIYENKIESRIPFKIKTGSHLEALTAR